MISTLRIPSPALCRATLALGLSPASECGSTPPELVPPLLTWSQCFIGSRALPVI